MKAKAPSGADDRVGGGGLRLPSVVFFLSPSIEQIGFSRVYTCGREIPVTTEWLSHNKKDERMDGMALRIRQTLGRRNGSGARVSGFGRPSRGKKGDGSGFRGATCGGKCGQHEAASSPNVSLSRRNGSFPRRNRAATQPNGTAARPAGAATQRNGAATWAAGTATRRNGVATQPSGRIPRRDARGNFRTGTAPPLPAGKRMCGSGRRAVRMSASGMGVSRGFRGSARGPPRPPGDAGPGKAPASPENGFETVEQGHSNSGAREERSDPFA